MLKRARIYLEISVPIQPKTSENLPKFGKNWQLSYGSTAAAPPAPQTEDDRLADLSRQVKEGVEELVPPPPLASHVLRLRLVGIFWLRNFIKHLLEDSILIRLQAVMSLLGAKIPST